MGYFLFFSAIFLGSILFFIKTMYNIMLEVFSVKEIFGEKEIDTTMI